MTQTCLVNLYHLNPASKGGMSRAAREISHMLTGLARVDQLRVIFAVGWKAAGTFPQWLGDDQVDVIPCLPEVGLSPLFRVIQPDLLVSPLYLMEPFDTPDQLMNAPHVVLVPDMAPLDVSDPLPGNGPLLPTLEIEPNPPSKTYGEPSRTVPNLESLNPNPTSKIQKLYDRLPFASKVVTISEYSRQRLQHHIPLRPDQITVIPLAGDFAGGESFARSGSMTPDPLDPPVELIQPYVFYPANGWPYKRHALLLQIMKEVWRVRPELKLALTGWREPGFITDLARRYDCPQEQIVDLGYVSDGQLVTLYRQAEALLFTSAYEGFGMPLLEAMANGCPVICTPLAAMPEVAGEAALYVNSDQPADWAKALLQELPARRASLIEQGMARARLFSWQRFRQEWLQVLLDAGLCLSPSAAPTDKKPGFGQNSVFSDEKSKIQNPKSKIQPTIPLGVVEQELVVWSNNYAAKQGELEDKAAEIQSLTATARMQANELAAQEEVIQTLQRELATRADLIQEQQYRLIAKDEIIQAQQGELAVKEAIIQDQSRQLVAKEEVIRQFDAFRWATLPYRVMVRPLQVVRNRALSQFAPRLGVLYHYRPIPLRTPDWYTARPAPDPAPLISIVTPSFNQAAFLERTINSVLDQNYPALEYIIQDGGSSDDTPAILDRYRSRLASCVSIKDNGQAHAINLGFAQASGEIMAWLNSDDLLLPGAFNFIANFFAEHPEVDVVYGHRVLIDENDDEIGRWVLPPHDWKVLLWADYVPQETLFWRRRIWEKTGGCMDESFRFALDWELLLRFQAAGAKMARLPRFLGAFRVHAAQKTSAQLSRVGKEEIDRLRQRCHGRPVSRGEIGRGIGFYLAKSVVYHKLYRLGLLQY